MHGARPPGGAHGPEPGAEGFLMHGARPPGHPHRGRHDEAAPVSHAPGRRARYLLLGGCIALLASGLAWLVLHDWWPAQTPFGPQPHPSAAWLLRLHGALAWCAVFAGGIVWQAHVRPAWRAVRRRRLHERRLGQRLRSAGHHRRRTVSGVLLVLALAALLATAIGLQYGPEASHAWLSTTHWAVGLALAAAVAWHWLVRLRG